MIVSETEEINQDDVEIAENQQFTKAIEKGIPHKIKITTDYKHIIKECSNEFVEVMLDSTIKKDKTVLTKDEKRAFKALQKQKFSLLRNVLAKKEVEKNACVTLATKLINIYQLLEYIGNTQMSDVFKELGVEINVPKLEDTTEFFKDESIKSRIKGIFSYVDDTQENINNELNIIKEKVFHEIPAIMIFDKTSNKNGLRPNDFDKIVTNAAIKYTNSPDKIEAYLKKEINNNVGTINRQRIMLETNKQLLT